MLSSVGQACLGISQSISTAYAVYLTTFSLERIFNSSRTDVFQNVAGQTQDLFWTPHKIAAITGLAMLALTTGSPQGLIGQGLQCLGADCLAVGICKIVGAVRNRFGVIPKDKYGYFSASKHFTISDIAVCVGAAALIHYVLGSSPHIALKKTVVYYGAVLVYKGFMYSIGLLRDNYKWSRIPNDQFEYFSRKSSSPDQRSMPHLAAILVGCALMTLVGPKL